VARVAYGSTTCARRGSGRTTNVASPSPPVGRSTPLVASPSPPVGSSTPIVADLSPRVGGSTPIVDDLRPRFLLVNDRSAAFAACRRAHSEPRPAFAACRREHFNPPRPCDRRREGHFLGLGRHDAARRRLDVHKSPAASRRSRPYAAKSSSGSSHNAAKRSFSTSSLAFGSSCCSRESASYFTVRLSAPTCRIFFSGDIFR
jgi:hypothetical protein